MNVLGSFCKRITGALVLFVLLLLLEALFGFLWGISRGEMLYCFGLEVLLAAAIFCWVFWRYTRKVATLRRAAELAVANEMLLPEATDEVDRLYQEIVQNVNRQRNATVGELAAGQKDMQEYYAMWVHQIKTPISAMHLLFQVERAQAEADSCGTPELEAVRDHRLEVLAESEEELFYIEEYVTMALQYQRLQAESNDLVLKWVKLDAIIRETIRKFARILIRKKIRVVYEGTTLEVLTDAKWMGFVFGQILSNAVKYTNAGEIRIMAGTDGGQSFVVIRDTGIGIRQEDLPRVFEKGYTGYNGHENASSTGIGLYLTKRMLKKLGHTIRISSEPGVGTEVRIGFKKPIERK